MLLFQKSILSRESVGGMHMTKEIRKTAQAMVADGKGILAMDESHSTIEKRFKEIGVENTEENRRKYRQLLITAPGLGKFISGAILFDETIRQKTNDGIPFPKVLEQQGIIPGIKVDKGAKPLSLFPNETITEGLDGLRERLQEYRSLGAKFAKWRAVITIGKDIPTKACIKANAHALARYAALCQEAGITPIVEPEVLMDGSHSIETCLEVTTQTLAIVFKELKALKIDLKGIVLKPNMVVSGISSPDQAGPEKVAELTIKCFKETVSPKVPGIAFLSGGQSDESATLNLNEMNRKFKGQVPWKLTFSYGRALQRAALKAWNGGDANIKAAQEALLGKAKGYGKAALGEYS